MMRVWGCLLISMGLVTGLTGCLPLLAGGAAATIATAHDRRTTGTIVEDQAIELKAIDALADDPRLKERIHVNVTSYNTAVLLSGEVASAELRQRAEDIVRRVEKVKHVHNELVVSPKPSSLAERSTDATITARVKTSLFQVDGIRDFDPTRVKVVTERGVVYLFGLLKPQEANAVTETVRRVSGIRQVVKLFEIIDDRPIPGAPVPAPAPAPVS